MYKYLQHVMPRESCIRVHPSYGEELRCKQGLKITENFCVMATTLPFLLWYCSKWNFHVNYFCISRWNCEHAGKKAIYIPRENLCPFVLNIIILRYFCLVPELFAVTGPNTGTIVTFILSAVLCVYGFAGGWPSVFYVFGENAMV